MSYQFYNLLHIIGIFMVIASLGAMSLHVASGGTRNFAGRKLAAAFHGIGLVITLVAGFGLLARLGLVGATPNWAYAKIAIWLVLGALPALIYRKPQFAKLFWFLILGFSALNAYLAIFKPF